MIKVLKYSFYDLVRSRWSYIYFLFFFVSTLTLLYLSTDLSKGIISLMNITLILCPLIGVMFGTIYYFNSREFTILLLSQPIKRASIFFGQYLGLSISLTISYILGIGVPFLFYGITNSPEIWNFATLIVVGSFLTFIFTSLAFLIAISNENRIKGFGIAILVWLFMAVIYDGIFLLTLVLFEKYPIERLSLILTVLNPIDLSRILIMLKLDISALFGYTGAVFNKFFGTSTGMAVAFCSLVLWCVLPTLAFLFAAGRRDF